MKKILTNGATAIDISSILGTAPDTNSGSKSAGTLRVVIATDQPQLTNALKVDGSAVTQPVSDASGSLTVDAPVGTPVFVRLSDGSSPITTLAVSLATVPSHAVTNAGTFAVQVDGAALTSLQLLDDVVFAEDVAAQAGDKGVGILAVRRDADTSLVNSDNDYANLQVDANGALKVEIFDGGGSHTVDNNGTFVVQVDGSALTSLQLLDDVIFTDDAAFTPATSKVAMVGAQVDDTGTDSVDEGDAGAIRMSANRNLYVRIRDNAGNERGLNIDSNGELGVSAIRSALPAGTNGIGKLTANSGVDIGDVDVTSVTPGTGATNLGKAVDSAAGSTDTGVAILGIRDDALSSITPAEGDYAPVRVDANGGLWVSLATQLSSSQDSVTAVGNIAHDSADSGNPLKIGGFAETSISGRTMVADGDRTDAVFGADGVIITRPHCNLEDIVSGNASNTDGTSTQVIAAAGSGIKTYLTSVALTNTSASNIYVELKDNTTVKYTIPVPANSGAIVQFPVPLAGSANVAWNFDPSTSASTIYCSAVGFKSKL